MWSVLETPWSNPFSAGVTEPILHYLPLQARRESGNDHKYGNDQADACWPLIVKAEFPIYVAERNLLFSLGNTDNRQRWKNLSEKNYLCWGLLEFGVGDKNESRVERKAAATSFHFMSILERTSPWFFHLFARRNSGSPEPGRLSDVRPPVRAHASLTRHAWVLNARSRHPSWKG